MPTAQLKPSAAINRACGLRQLAAAFTSRARSAYAPFNRLAPLILLALLAACHSSAHVTPDFTHSTFNIYGRVNPFANDIQVREDSSFTTSTGYGFVPGAVLKRGGTRYPEGDLGLTADAPFAFSVALPEGNYLVTLGLGDDSLMHETTVRSEQRRLMTERFVPGPNKYLTPVILVNVHTPAISTGGRVKLKQREVTSETLAWDNKLTLEFSGAHPCVTSIKIEPAPANTPVIYILGDSTVCDQPAEPFASWGQMLPRFFKPEVVVANYASSGESYKSSIGAKRLEKALSTMKPGDYLFMQFGHNDMKRGSVEKTGYKDSIRHCIAATRAKGATPVVVTSMERKAGIKSPTLVGYPEAAREVARETRTPLIDLNAMSLKFYKALGPNLDKAFVDGTHHSNYGAYEFAKGVIQGIKDANLPLAKSIIDDFKTFDPAHPDSAETFNLPRSARVTTVKPEGN